MSFRIDVDKYEEAYGHFMREIRSSIQETFREEAETRGLTQVDVANELSVHPSVISRRLAGEGNVTLRTICDLFTAMGRAPLSNFEIYSEDAQQYGKSNVVVNNIQVINNIQFCFGVGKSQITNWALSPLVTDDTLRALWGTIESDEPLLVEIRNETAHEAAR